jgi:hypothetical protein
MPVKQPGMVHGFSKPAWKTGILKREFEAGILPG